MSHTIKTEGLEMVLLEYQVSMSDKAGQSQKLMMLLSISKLITKVMSIIGEIASSGETC